MASLKLYAPIQLFTWPRAVRRNGGFGQGISCGINAKMCFYVVSLEYASC